MKTRLCFTNQSATLLLSVMFILINHFFINFGIDYNSILASMEVYAIITNSYIAVD